MAKSTPSSAFYWNDYYRDTRVLTLPTRAIWMDMLCRAHESQTRGQIKLSIGAWARWCACTVEDIMLAEMELRHHPEVGVASKELLDQTDLYNYESNVFITVVNRRMVREALFKENNAERQDRFRKKHTDNDEVTPHVTPLSRTSNTVPSSSSPSSSSSSDRKKSKRERHAMPESWALTEGMTDYGTTNGMTAPTIQHEFVKCKTHHLESRFTERGWESKVWQTWVLNWISFGAKQVTPQSATPPQVKCAYHVEACEGYAVAGSKYCQVHRDLYKERRDRREEKMNQPSRVAVIVQDVKDGMKQMVDALVQGKAMPTGV